MTELAVRRLQIDWSEPLPFLWNPENPEFSLQMNATTLVAIAFERYIAVVFKQAIAKLDDAELVVEADAFVKQEGQHCAAHRRHLRALARTHPGLMQTLDEATASYDTLLADQPLAYHLAYIADLESAFTPTFKLFLDHDDRLFRPGDERVASLFIWHFTEEVEHRQSGLRIYRAFGGELYRLWVLPSVARHIVRLLAIIARGINAHVPFEDRRVDARVLLPSVGLARWLARKLPFLRHRLAGAYPTASALDFVPDRELRAAGRRVLLAQLPNHDPEHQPLPELAHRWLARYDAGEPVARWYSSEREG